MKKLIYLAGGTALSLLVATGLLAIFGEGPFARDRVESVPWTAAVVSDDGRTITVMFTGAVEFDRDDPCHVEYSARATELPNEVRITVEGRERNVSKFCTLAGLFRQLTVELSSSLGDRQVSDGHDDRINPVRATDGTCIQPPILRPQPRDASDVAAASTTSTLSPPPPPIDDCDT